MHVHGNRCTLRSLRAAANTALIALVATGAAACVSIDDILVHISDSSPPEPGGSGGPCDSSGAAGDESTCGSDGVPDETGSPGATGSVPTGGAEPGTTGGAQTAGATSGMGSTGDLPPTFVCGDAMIDGDEVCDDGVNDGAYGGCMPGCAALAPFCGDGAVDLGIETCDGGGVPDDPMCSLACQRPRCGDGIVQAGEDCEAGVAIVATCESLGFVGGALGCDSTACSYDVSQCGGCGNGVIEGDEVCDAAELGGATCESLGLVGGALSCAATCGALDTTGCLGAPP
ncbi:MAG: hypothetical protein JNK56_19780 [Myxococcales bacterium]|nr:hypothetical protein [Myxococcales bacterium]